MARRRAGRGARKELAGPAKSLQAAGEKPLVQPLEEKKPEAADVDAAGGEPEAASTVSARTSHGSWTSNDSASASTSPASLLASQSTAAAQGTAAASAEADASPDGTGSASDLPPLPCTLAPAAAPAAPGTRAFSHAETLLILDWDDTCLPSSWVAAHGLRLDAPVPPELAQQLEQLAPRVATFLQTCKARGDVLLITNAERGWVERSCEKFLPSVVPDLVGTRVFSARSAYEQEGVFAPLEWKRQAFTAAIREAYGSTPLRNVLSLGDSPHERDALFTARNVLLRSPDVTRWHSKSVKFMERPDACQLLREHILVLQFFDQVLDHDGDLDLCIKCC